MLSLHSKRISLFLPTLLLCALLTLGFSSSGNPPKQQPQAADQEHNQPDGAINDDSTFFLKVGTWANANHDAIEALSAIGVLAFTIGLFVATGVLAFATFRLAKATAGLRDAEKEQANELRKARAVAEETLTLSERQLAITGRQTDIAEKQHAVEFLRFHANNRPRLRIRHIWLTRAIEPNMPVSVEIIYVNVGDTKAQVYNFGVDCNILWPGVKLPGRLTTPPSRPGITLPECGLGEIQSTGNVKTLAVLDPERVEGIRDGSRTLCCFGFLEYSDVGPEQTRKIRRTAFCRTFTPTQNQVEGIGRFDWPDKPDPDYEYED